MQNCNAQQQCHCVGGRRKPKSEFKSAFYHTCESFAPKPFLLKNTFSVCSVQGITLSFKSFPSVSTLWVLGHQQFLNFVYRKYTTIANIKAIFKNINGTDKDHSCCHISRYRGPVISSCGLQRHNTCSVSVPCACGCTETAVSTVIVRGNSTYSKIFYRLNRLNLFLHWPLDILIPTIYMHSIT